jgi:hypothetical protein
MTTYVSATVRETPHETETTQITINDALKRRAQAVIRDRSIDPQWRNIIRYALETNDPLLPDLVRRATERETPEGNEAEPSREKLEALAEIICGVRAEAAGALLVLMGMMQNSADPQTIANTLKHFAFTRCGELNLFGMVDAQIGVVEGELLEDTPLS